MKVIGFTTVAPTKNVIGMGNGNIIVIQGTAEHISPAVRGIKYKPANIAIGVIGNGSGHAADAIKDGVGEGGDVRRERWVYGAGDSFANPVSGRRPRIVYRRVGPRLAGSLELLRGDQAGEGGHQEQKQSFDQGRKAPTRAF